MNTFARPLLGLGPAGPAQAPSKIAPGDFVQAPPGPWPCWPGASAVQNRSRRSCACPSCALALRARRKRRPKSLPAILCRPLLGLGPAGPAQAPSKIAPSRPSAGRAAARDDARAPDHQARGQLRAGWGLALDLIDQGVDQQPAGAADV